VKCGDKKTATEVGAGNPPELIFFDCDGQLIHRGPVSDLNSVETAMKSALQKYADKEANWQAYDDRAIEGAKESKKLVVLAFSNDKEDSVATLKNFNDRSIAKKHENILFMKKDFEKDSAEAKKWGVTSAPTVLYIDPNKAEGKQVIEKVTGKQSVNAIRVALAKAFAKIEKDSK
jgi:thiol:disulfide interchange protein